MEKNARNQTDELIQLQKRKRLGQKQQVSFKELPLTWLSMKAKDIQTNLNDLLSQGIPIPNKPYIVKENKPVKKYLKDHAITVSQSTADRINKDIQKILTKSETEGINSRGVAEHITEKFQSLKTWEAERIARTEINAANNLVSHQRLLESDLVDYKQWITAQDHRVRGQHKHDKANHVKMNGEIARIGEPFSNGLQYPGDHNGPLAEFINCRCTIVPYIPDYDKIAPTDKSTWHEEDMQQLPTNTGQQITLQLQETQKLYDVMNGYLKLNLGGISVQPIKKPSLITTLLGTNGRAKININNPLKPKPKVNVDPETVWTPEEQQEFEDLMAKLEANGGTVKLKKGKVVVEAGGFKGITRKEIIRLEELHNKRLNIMKGKPGTIPKPKSKPKTKPKTKAKPKTKPKVKPVETKKPTIKTPVNQNATHAKPMIPTEEIKKMSLEEVAEYYDVEYQGLIKSEYDGKKYYTIVENFSDSTLTIKFEEGTLKSYPKGGIATPQEILEEVLRIPKVNKMDTDSIWFKNTNQGISKRPTKSGYDSLGFNVGGYNNYFDVSKKGRKSIGYGVLDDPHHSIVINPKNFKGGGKGKYSFIWKQEEGKISKWRHTIRHEFAHSSDTSRKRFQEGLQRACKDPEYMEIHLEEKYFTEYANSVVHESYAEHGGYVSYMLDHPEDHMKTIKVSGIFDKEKGWETKEINFEQYKEMYPKHYEYFRKLFLGE